VKTPLASAMSATSLMDTSPPVQEKSISSSSDLGLSCRGLRVGDAWGWGVVLLTLLILLPLAVVILHLGKEGTEWGHIVKTVLAGYLRNTLILTAGVILLVLAMGLPSAWLVSAYDFPGRKVLSWLLILPLAIPTYVGAFVYSQGLESAIPLLVWIRTNLGVDAFVRAELIVRYGLLILMMSGVLYPYIYLAARSAFTLQGRTVIEAARCLGQGPSRVFWTVALPMARPAVVAGTALVVMEVINDYGAVHFFGVPTLTEGIFRTWFGMGDKTSALRLAAIVMLVVAGLRTLEQALRGRARFVEAEASGIPLSRKRLRGVEAVGAVLLCLTPLLVGFFYPVGRLGDWAWENLTSDRSVSFPALTALGRGFALASSTALVATLLGAIFVYAVRLRENPLRRFCGRVAGLGYATPGAVIAVGVMVLLGAIDRSHGTGGPLLSGTLGAIGFAYLVRFFAIPLQFARAGMDRLGRSIEEASRLLGQAPLATFRRVTLPLLQGPLWAAGMLVFVDILKELPLTLVLRPANFETLATTAFSLASEARLQACAVPSLLIVATGAVGLMIMNRWLMVPRSHD